jgi:hypothetical protein
MRLILLALLACPFLSGCIAWEIRDEVRAANAHVCETNGAIGHTLDRLAEINQDIKQTNAQMVQVQTALAQTTGQLKEVQTALAQTTGQLATVYASLQKTDEHLVGVGATLDVTHPKLTTLDNDLERMRILTDVQASLKEVQKALGPLGKSLGVLSSAASFFGGGGEEADLLAHETEPAPTGEGVASPGAEPPPAGAAAAKAPPAAPAEPAAPKQDMLVGTWLLVYPPAAPPQRSGKALIITADGAYIEAEPDKPLLRGQWTRTRRNITFRPAAASPGQAPGEVTAELITLSMRTLTLRRGDEIKVYNRP